MKRNFVILAITLILTGLLGAACISLAQNVPPQGKWTKKADMPTARADLSASVVNNLIYVAGGWADKFATRLATFEGEHSQNVGTSMRPFLPLYFCVLAGK